MILQKIYHKLDEWIIMLSGDLEETDAGIVRKEMMELAGHIWCNRDLESQNRSNVNSKEVKE